MAESQYVKIQRIGNVAAAEVVREKITEHENEAVLNELSAAAEASGYRVAVDLAQVNLLSSAGLGGLITLHKLCGGKGGKLVLHSVQDQILQLMRLTHLHKLFIIAPDAEAAIKKAGS